MGVHYRGYRSPRTTQERRVNTDPELRQFRIRIRARRSTNRLPHYWDEILRERPADWKSYRKTQYRMKLVRPPEE
jgi:hypothetical protein